MLTSALEAQLFPPNWLRGPGPAGAGGTAHARRCGAMAGTEGTLLRQFPLFLPQNRAKTVYEGFISAQVLAQLLHSR